MNMKNNLERNKTMKKLISLLITIIFISSILLGCDWNKIFSIKQSGSTTSSTSITTNPSQLAFPENPTIEHGDNFTQDDIDFVLMLHGGIRNDRIEYEMLPNYLLYEVLTFAQKGSPLFLARFENPYIICAYLKPDVPEYERNEFGEYRFDATKYVWYKFYDSTQIPDSIEKMKLTEEIYLLYDGTIIKDIANGVEYNKKCKYYMTYKSEQDLEKITSNMLLYYDYPSWVTGESKFVPYVKYGGATFEVYIDENGIEYIYFLYESYYQDGSGYVNSAVKLFDYHYDALSPYFEILNEYIGYNDRIVKDARIKLDILTEYLYNGR